MKSNRRDPTAHLSKQTNHRVNGKQRCRRGGINSVTFQSRISARQLQGWSNQVPVKTTSLMMKEKGSLSSKTSPLMMYKKKYVQEHTCKKFHAYFHIATRAAKLERLQRQRNADLREAHSVSRPVVDPSYLAAKVQKERQNDEKNSMKIVRQQSLQPKSYYPPTFYPPSQRSQWITSSQQKKRNNMRREKRRKKERESKSSSKRESKRESKKESNKKDQSGSQSSIGRASPPLPSPARETRTRRIRPSTAPIHRSSFALGPFCTAAEELWKLKTKAVADSQQLFGPGTERERRENKDMYRLIHTRFRPGSAKKRVKGCWNGLNVRKIFLLLLSDIYFSPFERPLTHYYFFLYYRLFLVKYF